ncbi:MAG: hypothetical protein AAF563_16825 [Pseudomonadota bacterium]
MRWLVLCSALLLAGCPAQGPADDTFNFRFRWLSYVQGNDIQEQCTPGSPARIRLIYNAIFTEETRTFDLTAVDQGATQMTTRLWRGTDTITLRSGSFLGAVDPAGEGDAYIDPEGTRAIVAALDASGFYGPPPNGLMLRSDDYFWVGSACIDGVFMVQAYPKDQFDRIAFAQLLASFDPIQRPLPVPRALDLPPLNSLGTGNPQQDRDEPSALFYRIDVTDNLLVANWI